jgi:hypothetical protein
VNSKGRWFLINDNEECGDGLSENPHPCKTRKDGVPGRGGRTTWQKADARLKAGATGTCQFWFFAQTLVALLIRTRSFELKFNPPKGQL